jgi:hypothetical protein
VAVTEGVLEVVALVFEGVEGLVLNLPAGAGTSHQGHEVGRPDRDVRDPREVGHSAVGACSQYSRKFTPPGQSWPR